MSVVRFKALVVVVLIALVVFRFLGSTLSTVCDRSDYMRRRNVWIALTATAFLSATFWWYALFAIPLIVWAARRDHNPVALFLMLLHVIPPMLIDIPIVGINRLFELDNYRLLSICILVPLYFQLRSTKPASRKLGPADYFLFGWGVMEVALFVPPDLPGQPLMQDSTTNLLRRAFLYLLDTYTLYFVISRTCTSKRALTDAMGAFCAGTMLMAGEALYETARHWLLYLEIEGQWLGDPNIGFYLLRGGSVRAQSAAGHALALGFVLAISMGFWLCLQSQIKRRFLWVCGILLLCGGLLATYSRGSWIGALIIVLAFAAFRSGSVTKMVKVGVGIGAILMILAALPMGQRVVNELPFLGHSVDSGTLSYRERLASRAWELIVQHPLLGDQLAYLRLNDLRQGQGIIDFVNAYAEIGVFYGLLGLFFLVGFLIVCLWRAWTRTRWIETDPQLRSIGAALIASITGCFFMLASASFIFGLRELYFILGGLSAGFVTTVASESEGISLAAMRRPS